MTCQALAAGLMILVLTCSVTDADESRLSAEVEIERGSNVSELSIFIINSGLTDYELPTGANGAGHTVPEGQIAGGGTGIRALPKLNFERSSSGRAPYGEIVVTAPVFTSRQTRSAEEQTFVVPAGKRRLYYRFKVPSEYVAGEFKCGFIARPDLVAKAKGAGYGSIELDTGIPITRLIDVTDKKAKPKDGRTP
jgi:hypothetical protein